MREPKCERDQLDLLIDSATATYAGPPAGLEERIFEALNAERLPNTPNANQVKSPLRRLLPWAICLSAAACVLLVLLLHTYGPSRASEARNSSSSHPGSSASAVRTRGRAPVPIRAPKFRSAHHASAPLVAASPKLDIFPTPQPLTPQEQALVSCTTRASSPQLQALIKALNAPSDPLAIAAIHIPPLNLPEVGNN